jgi:hypothetical protein
MLMIAHSPRKDTYKNVREKKRRALGNSKEKTQIPSTYDVMQSPNHA